MRFKPCILALIISKAVCANDDIYPDSFADFFVESEKTVVFTVPGSKDSISLDSIVTFDSFKLKDTQSNKSRLREYLLANGIKEQGISLAEKLLISGFTSSEECQNDFISCIPKNQTEWIGFDYDYEKRKIISYVSSDLLEAKTDTTGYHSFIRKENALVNNSDIYFYAGSESDSNLTWSNETKLGLPAGYLDFDTQYRSSDDEFNLYKAVYDLDIENLKILAGYQSFKRTDINSTDFLSYGSNFSGTAITVASSKNLLKEGRDTVNRVYFFAPQSGRLEIFREDRLIFSRNIEAGQQSIPYKDLPSGIYDINIIVKHGENEVLRETRQVVNSRNFSLQVGTFDYSAEIGYLDLNEDEYSLYETSERYYARAALSYRPVESLILASSILGNQNQLGFQFGYDWAPSEIFGIQHRSSFFEHGDSYHSVQFRARPFNFSIRSAESSYEEKGISSLIYSNSNYFEYSGGASGQIFGGTGYVSYTRTDYKENLTTNLDRETFSASYSRPFWGGNLSASVFHNKYDDLTNNEDTSFNISWSKTFGNYSTRLAANSHTNSRYKYQNSHSYSTDSEQLKTTTTASISHDDLDGTKSNIAFNASGYNDMVKYSGYVYFDSDKDYSLSGSLNSSQIVSKSGFGLTEKTSASYISFNPKTNAKRNNDDLYLSYQIEKNGKGWMSDFTKVLDTKVVSIDPYNLYSVTMDGERDNIEVDFRNVVDFILPATHYRISPLSTPLNNQIFILSDKDGNPINSIRCEGDACRSIEELSSDGVYRVNFLSGGDFKITSENKVCSFELSELGNDYINASCAEADNSSMLFNQIPMSEQELYQALSRIKDIHNEIKEKNNAKAGTYDLSEIPDPKSPTKRVLKESK